MESMKLSLLMIIFLVLLATNLNLVQGLWKMSQAEEIELEMQLKLINKPAIKSFQTEHGDILDCVEIHKQLAFDHPLLRNHSIQMNSNIPKLRRSSSSRIFKASSLGLPNNIKCPQGSVLIRRVQKEDLMMSKFSLKSFGINFEYQEQGFNQIPSTHQIANVAMATKKKSSGVRGKINTWGPYAAADQFSSAYIFLASPDGSQIANSISTGWIVNPYLYPNGSRLFSFWTIDSTRSTGCYNMLCPGFVQVSTDITLGVLLQPLSTYGGPQYEIDINIVQHNVTGNWWIKVEEKDVGYYPKEVFTTLGYGATNVGWGGEIYSATTTGVESPAMGSAHFPYEGIGKAAYIRQMMFVDQHYSQYFPRRSLLRENVSKPECYNASYAGFGLNDTGYFMLFGGPPGCIF